MRIYPNLRNGLISYYKLDSNSNDSVGSNNGTDTSISYSSSYGKINQGASFNGSSSYINLNNKLASGTAITVSCWIYSLSASQAQDVTIFSNQNDTNNYGIIFARNTSIANQWGMFYGDGSGYWYNYNANYFTISANTWHHLVCTINANSVYVYLDGIQVINYSGTNNVNFTNSNNFTLGVDSTHIAGRYFNGYIDEVGIWSRALSSTEVSQLYNGGAGLTLIGNHFRTKGLNKLSWYQALLIKTISLIDSSTIADSISKNISKLLSDSNTILDNIFKAIGKFVSESSTTSDLINKSTSRSITESKTMFDLVNKGIFRSLNDSSTILDTITNIKILFKLLVESFTSSDFISKGISKLLTETKSLTDNLSKGLSKVFSEISSITEVFVRYIAKIIELFETTTIFEDFRLFINNKVARWKDLFSSKSSTWNDKDSNKNTNWIDKLKL